MKKHMLFVVAADSGGHILPALTLARRWKENHKDGDIVFISSTKLLDKKIVSSSSIPSVKLFLPLGKFMSIYIWMYPVLIAQIFLIFCVSIFYFIKYRPEKIITTGGLIALPVCCAGWLLRKKIELYELNVVPGKAVKFLMPFVQTIYILFERTKLLCRLGNYSFAKKCVVTDYPVRFDVSNVYDDKRYIIEILNKKVGPYSTQFDSGRKTLFVLGGSQGSVFLNDIMRSFFIHHKGVLHDVQVIHQVGDKNITGWHEFYAHLNIPAFVFGYYENVKDLYIVADVVVCRAGAGTLFELAFFKKHSLVIPLVANSTSHQVDNARAMTEKYPHLFMLLAQDDIKKDENNFAKHLLLLLRNH